MPPPITIAITCLQLIALLRTVPGYSTSKRSELISAVRRFCEICGLDPSEVIVDPQVIRRLADRASWQLAGLSKQSWANLLSRLTCAMKIAGIKVHRRRRNHKLDELWEALLAPLTRRDRDELHPFAGWCSVHQIEPHQVDQGVFQQYLVYLITQTIQRNPRERWHVGRRAWNRTVAVLPASPYPVIQNVEPEGWRGLRWEAFLPSLLAEIEDYKAAAVKIDLSLDEDQDRAIKADTLKNYLNNLRWCLSVLVQDGVPVDRFTSLSACLDPVLVKRALTLRLGGRDLDDTTRPGLHAMATAIVSIARYVGVSEEDLSALKRLARRVRHCPEGMSEKNRERLAKLEEEAARRALINLPFEMEHRLANVTHPTVRQAQEMQSALLLAILLFLPARIKNVAAMDLEEHFVRPTQKGGAWLVHFDRHEVKNKTAIDGRLNARLSAMLTRYVAVFRPVLLKSPTSKLFTGQNGTEKGAKSLSKQFFKLIKGALGLEVNAHLMRHFAGRTYLKANPGHYEAVRQMLGHKNIETTIRFYAGTDTEAAFERYDDIISPDIDPSFFARLRRRGRNGNNDFEAL